MSVWTVFLGALLPLLFLLAAADLGLRWLRAIGMDRTGDL